MDEESRVFTCLLCPADGQGKEKPFEITTLCATKLHLQKHLGCDATTRQAMMKKAKGRLESGLIACSRYSRKSFVAQTLVYNLPEPDGRQ